jgi:hypothetical protein
VPWHRHKPSIERNAELVADARRLFDQIDAAREELERRLRELHDDASAEGRVGIGAPGRFTAGMAGAGMDPADISWFAPDGTWVANASPDEIRNWWDSLEPWQQQALIASLPLLIGNLNGIPLATRAQANEINIRNEIDRLHAEVEKLDALIAEAKKWEPGQNLGADALAPEGLGDWQHQRAKALAAIESYEKYLMLPEPRQLYGPDGELIDAKVTSASMLAFDPANDAIATYSGPFDKNGDIPDWIKNLVVHVPGTTTKITDYNGTDQRGYRFYDASNNQAGAAPTAIITWAGGPLPQHVDAAWDGYSRDLGPKLHDFVRGVPRANDSVLTVTGHSYGGAVVGQAEADGMVADRILYVAGAGLGNDNKAVANFPGTRDAAHYSMIARNDIVTGSSQNADLGNLGHGASAQDDPDVLRVETGFTDDRRRDRTIEQLGPVGAHSGVYIPGSTSFNNMVGIFTGTEVEVYAQDIWLTAPDGSLRARSGLTAIGYQPNVITISDYEKQKPDVRDRAHPELP